AVAVESFDPVRVHRRPFPILVVDRILGEAADEGQPSCRPGGAGDDVFPTPPLVTWKDHAEEGTGMAYGIVMALAAIVAQAPGGKVQFEKARPRDRGPAAKAEAASVGSELKEARRLLNNGRYAEAEEALAELESAARKDPKKLIPALKAAIARARAEGQSSQ